MYVSTEKFDGDYYHSFDGASIDATTIPIQAEDRNKVNLVK